MRPNKPLHPNMWPHANPNLSPPLSRVKASVKALAMLVLHLHLMHVSPQFLSFFFLANYRLSNSQKDCLSQSEKREAQPRPPGVPW